MAARRSAIYEGVVAHARRGPVTHAFRRRIAVLYLDLDEIDDLRFPLLWSARRPAPVRFRRRDYLDGGTGPLAGAVRRTVAAELGWSPAGPVGMLTTVRTWGWCFNPITLFYCYDAAGERIEAVVASVTNTPWGERENYVLDARGGLAGIAPQAKRLHVSPFLPMDLVYDFHLTEPAETCSVAITARHQGTVAFTAGMRLRRRPLTAATLGRMLVTQPLASHRISAGIYREAFRLWRKGVAFVPHPER